MASPVLQHGTHFPQCQRWAADNQLVVESEEANKEKVETEVAEVEPLEVKPVEAKLAGQDTSEKITANADVG